MNRYQPRISSVSAVRVCQGYQTLIAKPFALSEKEVDWSRHYGTSYDHDIGIFVSMAQMFRLREEEWRQHGKHLYITAFPYGCE